MDWGNAYATAGQDRRFPLLTSTDLHVVSQRSPRMKNRRVRCRNERLVWARNFDWEKAFDELEAAIEEARCWIWV